VIVVLLVTAVVASLVRERRLAAIATSERV